MGVVDSVKENCLVEAKKDKEFRFLKGFDEDDERYGRERKGEGEGERAGLSGYGCRYCVSFLQSITLRN